MVLVSPSVSKRIHGLNPCVSTVETRLDPNSNVIYIYKPSTECHYPNVTKGAAQNELPKYAVHIHAPISRRSSIYSAVADIFSASAISMNHINTKGLNYPRSLNNNDIVDLEYTTGHTICCYHPMCNTLKPEKADVPAYQLNVTYHMVVCSCSPCGGWG